MQWNACVENAISLRRSLHRKPELTWEEHETAQILRNELSKADIKWRACAELGTIARFAQDAPGRHIALRSDMDALPIHEQTGVPWSSQVEGKMHACGHDGHAATLMATAWWLKAHEDQLPGPVSLLFQPAEEGGHGAKKMIEDGALDGIDAIFGWHNWPVIPFGTAICPDGPVMSANGTFAITLHGKGGHASQPELCANPLSAAAAITQELHSLATRKFPAQQSIVIAVTSLNAPSQDTVIPDEAHLGGSFRISDNDLRESVHHHITQTAQQAAALYGVEANVEMRPRYLATVNHPEQAALYRDILSKELGADWQDPKVLAPVMASEDFSYYLQEIPGAFALIGSGDGQDHHHPCHSPHFDFNDDLIPRVMRVFLRLAGGPLPTE